MELQGNDYLAEVYNAVKKYMHLNRTSRVQIMSVEMGFADMIHSSVDSTKIVYKIVARVGDTYETLHLFRKGLCKDEGYLRTFSIHAQVYPKEIGFYNELIPFIKMFQENEGLATLPLSVPELYGAESNPEFSYLILQNIEYDGFRNSGRSFLDYEEVLLCVRELAKIHAAGHALLSVHKNQLLEMFPFLEEAINHKKAFGVTFYVWVKCYEFAIEAIKSADSVLGMKMEKYRGKVYETILQQMNRNDRFLMGLSHGDLWFSNIMFRYEKEVAVDIKFVDFQKLRISSVTTDLTFFLYTSTTRAFRKLHYRVVLYSYLVSYIDTLRYMGVKVSLELTLDYLMQKMTETLPYAVTFLSFTMPMQLMDDYSKGCGVHIEHSMADALHIPDQWKELDQSTEEHLKLDQIEMAQNLSRNMHCDIVKSRMLEFYQEMNDLGVI